MKISVSTLSYGRTSLLEEAVESFIRQTHPDKEMVILNSLPSQTLVFNHPQVKVVNLTERPATLGETRNLAIQQCSGEFVVILDDDDVCLQGYMAWLLRHVGDMDWIRPSLKFSIKGGQVQKLSGPANNQLFFRKSAWEKVGGYPNMDSGEDDTFRKKLIQQTNGKTVACAPSECGFIYRFGHGQYNISAFGRNQTGQPTGLEMCAKKLSKHGVPHGIIQLKPHWDFDYHAVTRRWLNESGYSV